MLRGLANESRKQLAVGTILFALIVSGCTSFELTAEQRIACIEASQFPGISFKECNSQANCLNKTNFLVEKNSLAALSQKQLQEFTKNISSARYYLQQTIKRLEKINNACTTKQKLFSNELIPLANEAKYYTLKTIKSIDFALINAKNFMELEHEDLVLLDVNLVPETNAFKVSTKLAENISRLQDKEIKGENLAAKILVYSQNIQKTIKKGYANETNKTELLTKTVSQSKKLYKKSDLIMPLVFKAIQNYVEELISRINTGKTVAVLKEIGSYNTILELDSVLSENNSLATTLFELAEKADKAKKELFKETENSISNTKKILMQAITKTESITKKKEILTKINEFYLQEKGTSTQESLALQPQKLKEIEKAFLKTVFEYRTGSISTGKALFESKKTEKQAVLWLLQAEKKEKEIKNWSEKYCKEYALKKIEGVQALTEKGQALKNFALQTIKSIESSEDKVTQCKKSLEIMQEVVESEKRYLKKLELNKIECNKKVGVLLKENFKEIKTKELTEKECIEILASIEETLRKKFDAEKTEKEMKKLEELLNSFSSKNKKELTEKTRKIKEEYFKENKLKTSQLKHSKTIMKKIMELNETIKKEIFESQKKSIEKSIKVEDTLLFPENQGIVRIIRTIKFFSEKSLNQPVKLVVKGNFEGFKIVSKPENSELLLTNNSATINLEQVFKGTTSIELEASKKVFEEKKFLVEKTEKEKILLKKEIIFLGPFPAKNIYYTVKTPSNLEVINATSFTENKENKTNILSDKTKIFIENIKEKQAIKLFLTLKNHLFWEQKITRNTRKGHELTQEGVISVKNNTFFELTRIPFDFVSGEYKETIVFDGSGKKIPVKKTDRKSFFVIKNLKPFEEKKFYYSIKAQDKNSYKKSIELQLTELLKPALFLEDENISLKAKNLLMQTKNLSFQEIKEKEKQLFEEAVKTKNSALNLLKNREKNNLLLKELKEKSVELEKLSPNSKLLKEIKKAINFLENNPRERFYKKELIKETDKEIKKIKKELYKKIKLVLEKQKRSEAIQKYLGLNYLEKISLADTGKLFEKKEYPKAIKKILLAEQSLKQTEKQALNALQEKEKNWNQKIMFSSNLLGKAKELQKKLEKETKEIVSMTGTSFYPLLSLKEIETIKEKISETENKLRELKEFVFPQDLNFLNKLREVNPKTRQLNELIEQQKQTIKEMEIALTQLETKAKSELNKTSNLNLTGKALEVFSKAKKEMEKKNYAKSIYESSKAQKIAGKKELPYLLIIPALVSIIIIVASRKKKKKRPAEFLERIDI